MAFVWCWCAEEAQRSEAVAESRGRLEREQAAARPADERDLFEAELADDRRDVGRSGRGCRVCNRIGAAVAGPVDGEQTQLGGGGRRRIGTRSLEPGLRWSSSTGGPSALPH